MESVSISGHWHSQRNISLTVDTGLVKELAHRHLANEGKAAELPFPIASLGKQLQHQLDCSIDGRSLAILTREQNSHAISALAAFAAKGAGASSRMRDAVASLAYRLSTLNQDDAFALLSWTSEWARSAETTTPSSLMRTTERDRERWNTLLGQRSVLEVLMRAVDSVTLFTLIPSSGSTSVLRFGRVHPGLLDKADEGFWYRVSRWIGLAAISVKIPLPEMSSGARTHTRISAPSETVIEWFWLTTNDLPTARDEYEWSRSANSLVVYRKQQDRGGSHSVEALVRPRVSDFLMPAFLVSLLTACLLHAGHFLQANYYRFSTRGLPEELVLAFPNVAGSDAAATVLALTPPLATLLVLREARHNLVSGFYIGARCALVVVGVSGVLAAGVLAIGGAADTIETVLGASAVASSIATAYLVLAILSALYGTSRLAHWNRKRILRKNWD